MAARGRGSAYTVTILLLASVCLDQSYSAVHTVGGSKGWDLGVDYTSWAAGEKTFKVGDVLFFPYLQAEHNVVVVDKAGYDACSGANAIATYFAGNDNVTLNSTGTHYYLCSVIGHCSGGMKLAVTVSAAAAAAPPTASAPAPTNTPPTSAPSPVSSPTPVSAPTPSETPTSATAPVPAAPASAPSGGTPTSPSAPGSTPTTAAGTPPPPPPPNAATSLLASAIALTPVALLASLLAL